MTSSRDRRQGAPITPYYEEGARTLAATADGFDRMAFCSQPLLKFPEQGRHTLLEIENLSKHYGDVQVMEELEPLEALHDQYVS